MQLVSRRPTTSSYFRDFAAPVVVPAPDSFILRPLPSGRADPWLSPDSIPDWDRSRTAPVADPESSFLDDLESALAPRCVDRSALSPCCVPGPVDCVGSYANIKPKNPMVTIHSECRCIMSPCDLFDRRLHRRGFGAHVFKGNYAPRPPSFP